MKAYIIALCALALLLLGGCASDSSSNDPAPVDEPSVTLTADPQTVAFGGESVLSWTSENTESCALTDGDGIVVATGRGGWYIASGFFESTTYTINCYSALGESITVVDTATVTVPYVPTEVLEVTIGMGYYQYVYSEFWPFVVVRLWPELLGERTDQYPWKNISISLTKTDGDPVSVGYRYDGVDPSCNCLIVYGSYFFWNSDPAQVNGTYTVIVTLADGSEFPPVELVLDTEPPPTIPITAFSYSEEQQSLNVEWDDIPGYSYFLALYDANVGEITRQHADGSPAALPVVLQNGSTHLLLLLGYNYSIAKGESDEVLSPAKTMPLPVHPLYTGWIEEFTYLVKELPY